MTTRPRVLLTVGADTTRDDASGPRRDYALVAALLGADVLDRLDVERSRTARLIAAIAGLPVAQALLAFARRHRYDCVVTDGEHVGIPLALLLRCGRAKTRHITIGHRLSTPKKRRFFRLLRAQERIDRIALHSQRQHDIAVTDLGIEPNRLALLPYQVDTRYWTPQLVAEERLIVSAGLEHRDYATLFRAVDGLRAQVVIGAASHWSRHGVGSATPPPNVRIGTFDYLSLRDLYARASIVVVPLTDVDNQAGVTTILEGMAMGKPVIVTQSLGQTDVVEDRRSTARDRARPRQVSLARRLAHEAGIAVEPNGFYVAPHDADGLRRAITYLLDHPDERARLGHAGRQLAEQLFTVDQFAERIRSLVYSCIEVQPDALFPRRLSSG